VCCLNCGGKNEKLKFFILFFYYYNLNLNFKSIITRTSKSLQQLTMLYQYIRIFPLLILMQVTLVLSTSMDIVAPSSSSSYNATTICSINNLTDPDDCCSCFHSTCELVQANCPLGTSGTDLFNYFQMQYCALESVPVLSYFILCCACIIVFSLLGTTADNFFVTQLETLSESLSLSPSTAAITLLALGNSAPDVFSDLAAVQGNSDFNLAIGELVGASMFLTTVVLCAVIFYATSSSSGKGECKVDTTPIRDILSFFIVLVALLIFSITDSKITTLEASLLIGAYVVYVVCVIIYTKMSSKNKNRKRKSMSNGQPISQVDLEKSLITTSQNDDDSISEIALGNIVHDENKNGENDEEDDDEKELMVGIDWDSKASNFDKFTFIIEYPFSILRWLSIATADQKWSRRRRLFNYFVPMGTVTIVFLDFSPNWTGKKKNM
jgi:solute carrier family 24 (sodium/potassium/calcium exchanger), member 6